MTNIEKYMNTIVSIRNQDSTDVAVAMDIRTGALKRCSEVGCECCKFNWRYNANRNCRANIVSWLFEEYQEPAPKLTKAERGFCEIVKTGYIARDAVKKCLVYYSEEPEIDLNGYYRYSPYDSVELPLEPFSFITWGDKEPWSIEDLLKLEVEDETL